MSVSALISDARAYTGTLTGQAAAAMSSAISSAMGIGYSIPAQADVPLPDAPAQGISLTAPSLTAVDLVLPASPQAALVFQDIPALSVGAAPEFTVDAPAITLPTTPSQIAPFSLSPPSIDSSISFPSPPSELMNPLLAAPEISARDEPARPQTMLPAFEGQRPVDSTSAPADLQGTLSGAYRDAAPSTITMVNGYVDEMMAKHNPRYAEQMAKIESQLASYLAGGTALNPVIESAIYSRARSKNNAESRRVRDAAYGEAAGRGFTMPHGALMSAMQQGRQAAADNNTKASADIAIAQAEMEQKNLQFAVTTSVGLRKAILDASLAHMQGIAALNGQALEYAKTVLSAVVETYNVSLRAFSAKMEVYKADAQVFEVKLRGAMAGIELYRAEVSAMEALTQVDRSKVDVYRARIESLGALAGVYRSQIEAVVGRASLEKLKLDLFQSQVQGFTAQVQAKNAEWQGYSAAVEGQTAKVKMFAGQAEAFSARVQGFKATVEAQAEAVKAMATTNDSRARNYAAQWAGYQTVVQSLGEVARTKLENQRQEVVAFQAEVGLAVANAQVGAEYYRATSGVAVENARLKLSGQVQGAESQRAFGETLARLGTANAQIYAGLANSALSGMNTLAAETLAEG